MNVHAIYHGSDGEATKALYARLETLGPAGVVALNLFRAQKCSSRAKAYRRHVHKQEAYGRKDWSLQNLCAALEEHAADLGIEWGWKEDPQQSFHRWVLYVVVLPGGQVSFHSAAPKGAQRFTGDWDGTHESANRILLYTKSLFMPAAPNIFPTPECAARQKALPISAGLSTSGVEMPLQNHQLSLPFAL